MENKAHALAAGLFTLFLGAAVLVAAMWFSGETYEKERYVLESKYAVTGLNEQAAVRYRGVDIGKVTGIRFAPETAGTVLVDIAVQSDMTLTRGTFAELRYQGITGLAYVMLDDTGKNPQPLPPAGSGDSARIPLRESLFSSLADTGQQVLVDAREVMRRVNTLLSDENQTRIVRMLGELGTATRQITRLAQALEPAAKSSDALIAEARATFQRASALLGEISDTNRELAQRLDAIERVAGSAETTSEAVGSLAEAVASETLPRINILTDELARASRSLDRLAGELKDQPQSLVFGRKPGAPGPGEPGFDARGKAQP